MRKAMAIDGTYRGVGRTLFGSANFDLTMRTEGTKLTGTASGMGITAELQDGRVDDNAFSCRAEADTSLGHAVLDISGRVEGDRLTGITRVSGMRVAIEARRV
jgi:hypothetical protein